MNDRNAFLQGQGSPIKDDEPPPVQGWRGERSADESASAERQIQPVPGTDAEAEILSGVAFAEAKGLTSADMEPEDRPAAPLEKGGTGSSHPDGVSNLHEGANTPGGESAGAPYPHPETAGSDKGQFGTALGHGGQTEIAYHGPGHLGERRVDDDDNRNGVTESD